MRTLARLTGTLTVLYLALAPSAGAFPGANGDIVYQRHFKGGSEIFSYDPSTGRSTRLTSNAIRSGNDIAAGDPAFSADGRKVVFTNAVKTRGPGARRNNLFIVRADGRNPRRLTRSNHHQSSPAFSPDGSTIVFSERGDIWAIDADGSDKRNLTAGLPGGGGGAVFSPGGTRIALTTADGGDADIVVMNADGTDPVNVTAGSADDEYSPAFSPEGSTIAFVSDRVDYHGDLFVMDAAGTDVRPVTSDPGVEHGDPAFSPDGTQLLYTSRRSASAAVGIFTIGVEGGPRSKIPGTGVALDPDWGVAPSGG